MKNKIEIKTERHTFGLIVKAGRYRINYLFLLCQNSSSKLMKKIVFVHKHSQLKIELTLNRSTQMLENQINKQANTVANTFESIKSIVRLIVNQMLRKNLRKLFTIQGQGRWSQTHKTRKNENRKKSPTSNSKNIEF